jgi:hypothetical protein
MNKMIDAKQEHKFQDKTFTAQQIGVRSGVVVPSFSYCPNNIITQGTGNQNRIAARIRVKRISYRLNFLADAAGLAANGNADCIRICIGYSANPVYGDQTTVAGLSGYIESASNLQGVTNPFPIDRMWNKDTSDIHWFVDKTVCVNRQSSYCAVTDTYTNPRYEQIEGSFKCDKLVVWDTSNSTSGATTKGSLIVYACNHIDVGATAPNAYMSGNVRWEFVDA